MNHSAKTKSKNALYTIINYIGFILHYLRQTCNKLKQIPYFSTLYNGLEYLCESESAFFCKNGSEKAGIDNLQSGLGSKILADICRYAKGEKYGKTWREYQEKGRRKMGRTL